MTKRRSFVPMLLGIALALCNGLIPQPAFGQLPWMNTQLAAAAGQRAAVRGDTRLVQAWLGRAARLLPADHPLRLAALPPLAEVPRSTPLDTPAHPRGTVSAMSYSASSEGWSLTGYQVSAPYGSWMA